ncbi:MAG: heavy-metal-associated domain-containing protein [bacterium]
MFNLLNTLSKSKSKGERITFKLSGLHCTSCSLNIDGTLEDTKGVLSSATSYAKSQTNISYDPTIIDKNSLIKVITNLGYQVVA